MFKMLKKIYKSPAKAISAVVHFFTGATDSYFANHKAAINLGVWALVLLTLAAVPTFLLWPAALAAVAALTIAGFSIGGLVASNAAQIVLIIALATTATWATIFVCDSIISMGCWLFGKKEPQLGGGGRSKGGDVAGDDELVLDSPKAFSALGSPVVVRAEANSSAAPAVVRSILSAAPVAVVAEDVQPETSSLSAAM